MAETQKEKIMRILGVDEAGAEEILAADKAIDRGERMAFDLDPETEKMAKKMANAGTRKKPTVYNFDTSKRQRKENPTKANIIATLFDFLSKSDLCENVLITNKERQISFSSGENKFELTLVQKRNPK